MRELALILAVTCVALVVALVITAPVGTTNAPTGLVTFTTTE